MLRRLAASLVLLCASAIMPAQAQELAPIPKLTGPVIDTTLTLDAATRQQLEAQALALQQRKGSQLQVLVVPTTQPEDIAQYAVRAFDQYQLGRKGTNDGVLVVVAKNDHRARIEVGYGLEGAIPDATAIRIITEYMTPKFRAGDFNGGLIDATGAVVKLIDGEQLPAPLAEPQRQHRRDFPGGSFMFALFAAFIVAQVARGFLNPLPSFLRGIVGAAAAGGVAWLISHLFFVVGLGGLIGFLVGLVSLPRGRYADHGGWGGFGGGGGWGGGGFGGGGGGFGGGGGGWGGGGGMSGGGGASGSW